MSTVLLPLVLLVLALGPNPPGPPPGAPPGSPARAFARAAAPPGQGSPWRAPLDGPLRVARGFAPPPAWAPWLPGHRGVDLLAGAGEPVRAAGAGQVTYAGLLAGRGVVVVRHDDGLRTTYEPVLPSVGRGDRVALGAVLGTLDVVGSHCRQACLHWGLRRGPVYLDPLLLLGPGAVRPQVRLLPFLGPPEPVGPLRLPAVPA